MAQEDCYQSAGDFTAAAAGKANEPSIDGGAANGPGGPTGARKSVGPRGFLGGNYRTQGIALANGQRLHHATRMLRSLTGSEVIVSAKSCLEVNQATLHAPTSISRPAETNPYRIAHL